MTVSIAEAKKKFTELIRAVEGGEQVVITRHGKPVAQLSQTASVRRKPMFGGMRDKMRLLPGWDEPINLDEFLESNL